MKNEQGNTIVITMMIIATFAALISVSFDFTTAMDKNGERTEAYQAAANIADGLIDQAFTVWKTASQNRGAVGEITTADLKTTLASYTPVSASVASSATGFYYTQDLTVGSDGFKKDFKITHIDGFGNDVTTSVTPTKTTGEDYLRPAIGADTGLRNFYYKAHVGVTVPIRDRSTTGASVHVETNRYFVKRFKSPWSFAIFYNDNLELHPGPDMIINGWIHSNGTFYAAENSVHMMGRVTYGNGMEGNYAPGDSRRISGSNLFPTSAPIYGGGTDLVSGSSVSNGYLDNWTSTSPPTAGTQQKVIDISSSTFNTTDSNPNNDDFQEIIEPPNASYPDPAEIAGQRYYNKADLLVQISGSPATVSVKVKTGEDANGYSIYGVAPDATLAAVFTPSKTVRDNRWGGNVDVTDIDVSQLTARSKLATTDPKYFAGNKTIYVYDSRGTSTTRKGIRLIRGAALPSGGLTFASQNPVYVQGDYNTNGTYATTATTDRTPSTQPVSNSSTPDQTKPTITGTIQQPAAIIADAVTVLSNAWNDATVNSSTTTVTAASRTTVNSAFMTGNVETTSSAYSGGAENFPRFLEDWTNIEFTYWGSMVEMFQSQQANQPWGKSNVYSAPKRRWNFDSRLVNNPPPGTPYLVSYSKTDGRWFLQ
ncbi:MAG: hypothetical protein ABIT76_07085 [Chthoniobacterales bacterium]